MQVRRWWLTVALIVIGGASQLLSAAPPAWTESKPAIDSYLKSQAAAMKAAPTPNDAAAIRQEIESGLVPAKGTTGAPPAAWRSDYVQGVVDNFPPLLKDANSPAALNAVILIAHMDSQYCDNALRDALTSPNPAIRYWAAKGLGSQRLVEELSGISAAFGRAVTSLTTALATEKSPMVRKEIVEALKLYKSPATVAPLTANLKATAVAFGKAFPATADADSARAQMDLLSSLCEAGLVSKTDLPPALQATSDAASFAAQRLYLLESAGTKVTPDQKDSVYQLGAALAKVMASASKSKAISLGAKSTSDTAELLGAVNDLTGSTAPGEMQKLFPDVKPPVRLK